MESKPPSVHERLRSVEWSNGRHCDLRRRGDRSAFREAAREGGGRRAAASRACWRRATRDVTQQSRGAFGASRALRARIRRRTTPSRVASHRRFDLLLLATVTCARARKSTLRVTFLMTCLASTSRRDRGLRSRRRVVRSACRDVNALVKRRVRNVIRVAVARLGANAGDENRGCMNGACTTSLSPMKSSSRKSRRCASKADGSSRV